MIIIYIIFAHNAHICILSVDLLSASMHSTQPSVWSFSLRSGRPCRAGGAQHEGAAGVVGVLAMRHLCHHVSCWEINTIYLLGHGISDDLIWMNPWYCLVPRTTRNECWIITTRKPWQFVILWGYPMAHTPHCYSQWYVPVPVFSCPSYALMLIHRPGSNSGHLRTLEWWINVGTQMLINQPAWFRCQK